MADDISLAMRYLHENKPRAARKLLRKVLEREPNNLTAIHALGITHLRSGKLVQAEQIIGKAVQAHPNLAFGHNNLGEVYRLQGKLKLAAASFSKALAIDSSLSEAHTNLGMVLEQLGQLEDAVACYRSALSLTPTDLETHQYLFNALFELGRLEEAETSLRAVLAGHPHLASAHNNLGLVLKGLDRLDEAVASFREAIGINPDFAEAHSNLGISLQELEQLEEAVSHYVKSISIDPDYADAHYNLGVALEKLGRPDEAVSHYRNAIEINPDFSEAQYNLGIALKEAGRLDEAVSHYRKAIGIKPDFAEAHSNLGIALQELGQPDKAVAHYRKALGINPDYADAHYNLGIALQELGQLDESISQFRKAIGIRPDYAEAHSNLANVIKEIGRLDEAVSHYRKAIGIKPDYAEAHSNLLLALHYDDCAPQDLFKEHKMWNEQHAEHPQALICKHENGADREKTLHVGFVSGDFREHSAAYFLGSFFAARNRQRFVFHCYSNTSHEDAITSQLRESVDEWRNISGQDDQMVAEIIRADQIDILVDLSGHTRGNRLAVFARKPAPVQVTWLGYPNTTGLAAMDYRITDPVADPPGQADKFYVERLVRLPDGFLCYRPPDDAPDVAPLPMAAKGNLTFVSFNNLSKVTTEVIKVWARILEAVPGSELLMKCQSFTCPEVRRRYLSLFEQESIESGRLSLISRSPSTADHLAMYGRADIALDSFPYNGTTTTCEALWMGVPVVVLRGDRHAARVGASLLSQVGLDSLISEDADEYVEKAVTLANDITRLETLRKEMRTRMQDSMLSDAKGFAGNMETAFQTMWNEWCKPEAK